jgi:hypothetical protein
VEAGGRAGKTLLTPPIAFTVVVASNPAMRLPNLERDLDHNNILALFLLKLSYTSVTGTEQDTIPPYRSGCLQDKVACSYDLFHPDASQSQQQYERHNTIQDEYDHPPKLPSHALTTRFG